MLKKRRIAKFARESVRCSVDMKRIIFATLFLFAMNIELYAASDKVCRTGFSYEISQSVNWGYGMPVVTEITPYSAAERAGMQLYDIIEQIDGISVLDISPEEIDILLNPANKQNVTLTIRSTFDSQRLVVLPKECKSVNAISESQLAQAFNMYSLETTYERDFVCPFTITVTNDSIDFSLFRTYAFADVDPANEELEHNINRIIRAEMQKKGFSADADNPDLLIQTFYYFDKNPDYVGPNPIKLKQSVYRYDFTHSKMRQLPFLEITASESEAAYLLQFGIRIIDQKLQKGRVLWECEANELLEEAFHLEKYAQIHVPLMCMQFPYVKNQKNIRFHVKTCVYNYTGINYDMEQLNRVISVDTNSPAYAAGIRAKDEIEDIEGQSLEYSVDEFTAAYRQFIMNTMNFRDASTRFTDCNGFKRCMYWDTFQYPEVNKAIHNPNNLTAFAYLYYFAPYINPTSNNAISFDIKRKKERKRIIIRPTIRTGISVTIHNF